MIEATCSACGTRNRIAEADVPAGAKFVNCSSCKSRVALGVKTGAIPSIPSIRSPGPLPKMPPPTPKGPPPVTLGPSGVPNIPPMSGNANDKIEIADLPAPKRQSSLGSEPSRPAPRSGLSSALGDLPAPRPPGAGPAPSIDLDDLMGSDLPVPRSSAGVSDLPAPKAKPMAPLGPPPAAQREGISDLPAPKPRPIPTRPQPAPQPPPRFSTAPTVELPMPKHGLSDLPTPKPGGLTDLPMPKHGLSDLPTPKPGGPADLLTPRGGRQVPGTDLTPKGGSLDLPAPKGFFDDLPQPAQNQRPEVPAPKGFFDDLPGRAPASSQASARAELPAPKGFFDDLPQPALNKPTDAIAPKGFFDDLPQPALNKPTDAIAPKGFFDDLPQPARTKADSAKHQLGMGAMPLDLGDDAPIELAEQLSPIVGDAQAGGGRGSFDDLDLSRPSVGQNVHPETPAGPPMGDENKAVIRFGGQNAQTQPPQRAPLPTLGKGGPATDSPLELAEPKQAGGVAKAAPKTRQDRLVENAAKAAGRRKRTRIVLGAVLGLAIAGGGGYFLYQRHAAAQEREEQIDSQLAIARKSLVAEDANHWQRAMGAASQVVELDPSNSEALGIGAEAAFAGAFADGKTQTARFAKGRKLINDALSAGVTGPALDRAQALATMTTAPDKAIPKLQQLAAKSPKDGTLALYLGWAQASAGDPSAAIKSFETAMKVTPSLRILALDGRARSKLSLADIEGARSDFNEILVMQKDNIAAQVGIASTLAQSQEQQQEADLLAILARKDIKDADPRAVVAAWVLAGDDALRGRRLDAARERYRKALVVDSKNISAMTGLAETELRDRKIEIANEQIIKALTISTNDVRAQLVAAEIEIQLGKIDSAAERIQRLGNRKPPLVTMDQAKLQLITGRMLEAQNKDEAAVDAYAAAAKLAGDFDLTPTMAAVQKLNDMARKADEARNPAKEAEYRDRADQLLSVLIDKATTDPQLAMTLGVAYLQSSQPEKAETLLRRVVEARPTDADALYQYGKALGLTGKLPEAVENLNKARELAPGRSEIGLELAITYERMKDDAQAGSLYDALVAKDDASLETRSHAGKYYVRTKQLPKAGEQGAKIVSIDPDHAGGHYLKGEGLMAQGRFEDARREFGDAVLHERDPLYLDGQGRATEQVANERNDTALLEAALRAYISASEIDPLMFSPLLGAGRVYVKRKEHAKAAILLIAAQQLRGDDAEVAYYLGVSYQELGQKKDLAIKWLEFSLAKKPSGEAAYRLGDLYRDETINKPASAQSSYGLAVRLAQQEEKAGATVAYFTDALYWLGRTAFDRGDEGTAKSAWEKWVVRPGANRDGARYQEVQRMLATSLKTVGPPPPQK